MPCCLHLRILFHVICCKCALFRKKKAPPPSLVKRNALVLGLDGAGKSALLRSVTGHGGEGAEDLQPTMGFAIKEIDHGQVAFSFWEVGGAAIIRKFWHRYVNGTIRALVYVVDASDRDRFAESKEALHTFFAAHAPNIGGKCPWPVLILANFQDRPLACTRPKDLSAALGLADLAPAPAATHVECVSASPRLAPDSVHHHAIVRAMDWLEEQCLKMGGIVDYAA